MGDKPNLNKENWIGLIPAAGRGLRLGLPYPKELYPIIRDNRYKPVSQFIVDQIIAVGVKHIVFVINETKHQLIGYFGSGVRFDCLFSYVFQEHINEPDTISSPGLAHAIDSAFHLTKGRLVFFGMADTIIQPNDAFSQCLDRLIGDDVTLCLIPTASPYKFGMVDYAPDGTVREIFDKPKRTHLSEMWACMIWKPVFSEYIHEEISTKKSYDFARIMNNAITNGLKFGCKLLKNGTYIDLGTYDEIMEMDKLFRGEYS